MSAHLSDLTTKFGQNVLKELNTYEIWLTADDLSGLPESSVEAAALSQPRRRGVKASICLRSRSLSTTAFMKYSDRPDLRERFYRLYNGRNTKGEYSNMEILADIAETRREIAALFGKKNYAEYSLERAWLKLRKCLQAP